VDFETFMTEAWSEHADEPESVAQRLENTPQIVQELAQIPRIAQLAAHVLGEHLGRASARFNARPRRAAPIP
jgi:hypothetical protein